MMTTTLDRIRSAGAYIDGWKLVRHLGSGWPDDAPIPLTTVLDVCGLEDVIWCLRACDGGAAVAAEFAAWCAARAADAEASAEASAKAAAYATRTTAHAAARAATHAARAARAVARAAMRDALGLTPTAAAASAAFFAERKRQAEHLRSLI